MHLYIDDTGDISPNHQCDYFGFLGLLINDFMTKEILAGYEWLRRHHNFPEEFKINRRNRNISSKVHKELQIKYKAWLHHLFEKVCSIEVENKTFYPHMMFIARTIDKTDRQKYEEECIIKAQELKKHYPPLREIKNDSVILYHAELIRTMIDSLGQVGLIYRPELDKFIIRIDENKMYQHHLESQESLYRSVYLGCKNTFEKYYEEFPIISDKLPLDVDLKFVSSESSPLIQMAHNIAHLGSMEELERRGKRKLCENDRFLTKYKGLFLGDDGFVKKVFDHVIAKNAKLKNK